MFFQEENIFQGIREDSLLDGHFTPGAEKGLLRSGQLGVAVFRQAYTPVIKSCITLTLTECSILSLTVRAVIINLASTHRADHGLTLIFFDCSRLFGCNRFVWKLVPLRTGIRRQVQRNCIFEQSQSRLHLSGCHAGAKVFPILSHLSGLVHGFSFI